MKKTKLLMFLAALLLTAGNSPMAQVYGQSDLLGSQRLDEKSKRDTVRVAQRGATYSGIQIEVVGAGNILKRATVQFDDRSSENFNESRLKSKSQRTDILWFRSRNMAIEKVSLLYHPDVTVAEGAEIRVYGIR